MQAVRKYSRKREAIYKAIMGTKTHPNAEWIYAKLKPEYPDLSLGTVYRNLTLFKENEEIVCVGSVNGQERFDGNVQPHAHFICKACGCVQDLMDQQEPQSPIVQGRVEGYQLSFYGLCKSCCNKEAEQNALEKI